MFGWMFAEWILVCENYHQIAAIYLKNCIDHENMQGILKLCFIYTNCNRIRIKYLIN